MMGHETRSGRPAPVHRRTNVRPAQILLSTPVVLFGGLTLSQCFEGSTASIGVLRLAIIGVCGLQSEGTCADERQ
jgi:hypothetical protein